MAGRTMTVPAKNTETAVIAQSITHEELMALLGQTGQISQGGGDFHRMTLSGGMLVTDAGTPNEMKYPPTDKGRGPAFLARIVEPPVYYNAFYCNEKEENGAIDARRFGRGDLNGKFLKKYDDPNEQAKDQYSNLDGYEAAASFTNTRGSFKADIKLQIMPDDGVFTGDEPVYVLSLSTTSALDWRGTSANPAGGIVQDKNFIVQLAEFAVNKVKEEGGDTTAQKTAVLDAMTALGLGGVVAAVYIRQSSNEDRSRTWSVVSFEPVHVELNGTGTPALEGGDTAPAQTDEVPF